MDDRWSQADDRSLFAHFRLALSGSRHVRQRCRNGLARESKSYEACWTKGPNAIPAPVLPHKTSAPCLVDFNRELRLGAGREMPTGLPLVDGDASCNPHRKEVFVVATADQIKALVESHSEGDDERFYAVALQMAAKEARAGHSTFAHDLKQLVDEAKGSRPAGATVLSVATPRGELSSLLTASYPDVRLADMALPSELRSLLKRVVNEQTNRDRLYARGFTPLRRLLLLGPPGTGKTMTASALAGELSMPLFAVRLDGLINKFMGETASKLRLIFDAMAQTTGVYLFDEVDALAGARDTGNDVGEIRRVLNSFLQFIEQDESESVLIATSNLPDLLDRALYRRFDTTVRYPLPTTTIANKVIRTRLASMDLTGVNWRKMGQATKGLSHAEVTAAAEFAAKDAILAGASALDTKSLVASLEARRSPVPSDG